MAKRDALFVDGKNYNGGELRGLLDALQAGVFLSGDFKVTTTGAALPGALTSADGEALIQANQAGLYRPGKYLVADTAAEGSAAWERTGGGTGIPQNIAANPRLDAVVLHQYDSVGLGDGSGRSDWVREYVPGVAAPGAALGGTLPALPTNSLLIAEVLVPASSPASIPGANIRDRRPWARGAKRRILRTSNAAAGVDYSITVTTAAAVDATNIAPRLECSGTLLRIRPVGTFSFPVGQTMYLNLRVDGSQPADAGDAPLNATVPGQPSWEIIPTAGSHIISLFAHVSSGTGVLYAQATRPFLLVIEEDPRQNADNT